MARSAQATAPKFARRKVGDRVGVQLGLKVFSAKVIEDRGPLAVGGLQLVRVLLERDSDPSTDAFEVSVAALKPAPK